ncbi:efflux RND transporter periplasmic adaptor subunit [Psychrobacter alimentarius]|uniref:efflux RND transporter periplasmic adaptor subunit n=1 Tax=Psychrobacter alimentarius TaxID=261164 RepID=UPI0019181037|nr:HlyD family efflux transporter periplasmic adaptor subunit [Psychrobacter alimentarius]
MTASQILKTSTYLLSALILAACQPSAPTDASVMSDDSTTVDTPLVITDDSVTMAPDHILSIKPSRYQPSIGLQGNLEPVKQIKLMTVHPMNIEDVLVTEGQLVEKDMPLLIVRRVRSDDSEATSPNPTDNNATTAAKRPQERELMSEATDTEKSENSDNSKSVTAKDKSSDVQESDASVSDNDDNTSVKDNVINSGDNESDSKSPYNLVTIRASFKGRVQGLSIKAREQLAARTPLLQLNDETQLYFVSTLPIQAKPQLSIGQTVNFSVDGQSDNFTGQISKLTVTSQPKKLLVHVDVIENKASRATLLPNMKVIGRVDYGQIDVGTIVPERALHDVDLAELHKPPYKPLIPLTANVWIIGQDQRLMRRPIEVVEYNPTTKQYLIAGISNDSLICLADLPIDSNGKKVIVS